MASSRVRSLLFVTLAVLCLPGSAAAYPTYHPNQATAGVLPPNQASLPCTTCHVSASGGSGCGFGPCFNPFGVSYRLNYACACPSPAYVGDGRISGSGCCALGTSRPVSGGACEVVCGDGGRDPTEACDDGNIEDGDGCSASCDVELGYLCAGVAPGPMSVCALSCGDQLIDPPETCDDGANNSDTLPNACRTSCLLAYCGDGVVDDGEVCDRGGVLPANANPDACTAAGCEMPARDGGVDIDGGGGGCAITPATRADGAFFAAAIALALAAIRRRRRV